MTSIKFNKAWDDLKKYFNKENPSVQVGVFSEQGRHESSGRTYVDLLTYHHYGGPYGEIPDRPVLTILKGKIDLNDNKIKGFLVAWSKRPLSTPSDNKLMQDIGEYLRDKGKDIFGSSELTDNALYTQEQKGNRNTPLINTDDLRKHFAFRTSIDNIIREGK